MAKSKKILQVNLVSAANESQSDNEAQASDVKIFKRGVDYKLIQGRSALTAKFYIISQDMRKYLYDEYGLCYGAVYHSHDDSFVKQERDENATLQCFKLLDRIIGHDTSMDSDRKSQYLEDVAISELREDIQGIQGAVQEAIRNLSGSSVVTAPIVESLFERGETIVFTHDGSKCAGVVMNITTQASLFGVRSVAMVKMLTATQNGLNYGNRQISFSWPGDGMMSLDELPFTKISEADIAELAARGKKVVSLAGNGAKYVQYSGPLSRYSWRSVNRLKADGRIMLDYGMMTTEDPDYYYYFILPDNFENGGDVDQASAAVLSDKELAIVSPFVYGFSFRLKKWGEFLIDNVSEIEFQDDAYDKVVLDPVSKEYFQKLSSVEAERFKDLISGKSSGLIFLLEGKPGTGKTLTAEAMAESMHRPLYSLDAGEIGTSAEEVERKLKSVNDLCCRWNAVLLINEADIFLQQRHPDSIERNAMVAIFLREIEYYQGVMFLTTNCSDSLDSAVRSRITMVQHFADLDSDGRKSIWTNVAQRSGITLEEDHCERLAYYEINGREINNVVKVFVTMGMKTDDAEQNFQQLESTISFLYQEQKNVFDGEYEIVEDNGEVIQSNDSVAGVRMIAQMILVITVIVFAYVVFS